MKKRLILLLTLAAIVLLAAPVAMADHCYTCKIQNGVPTCWFAVTGGRPICNATPNGCTFQGSLCTGPHPFIEEDFGADFIVASVERIDEPKPAPAEPQVASLETPPATR